MPISINDSVARFTGTPTNTTAITSASFTPANGSLLVACAGLDEINDSSTVAITVSGGSLTWTQRVRRGGVEAGGGLAAIWTAPVVTGAGMTVSIARTATHAAARVSGKVYIVTGQHASPIGNIASANWTTNPQTLNLTAAGAGRVFGCGTDWNATGLPVSTDTEDAATHAGEISVMSAYKAADHASGSQGIQFDPVGTPLGNCVVLEILAAAAAGGSIMRQMMSHHGG